MRDVSGLSGTSHRSKDRNVGLSKKFLCSVNISTYRFFLLCFPALLDPAELYWVKLKEKKKRERFKTRCR